MPKLLFTKAYAETVEENGVLTKVFIASTDVVDRMGESVSVDGWQLDDYKKNPVILWSHNNQEPAIGKATKIGYKTLSDGRKALVYTPVFHKKTQLSQAVSDLIDDGTLNATSVGFMPLEKDGNTFTKQELLELSIVNVPANQEALSLGLATKGFDPKRIKELLEEPKEPESPKEEIETEQKGVIPYHKYPDSPADDAWDGPAEVGQASVDDLKKMCTWFDSDNADVKGSYKLPHHTVSGYRTVLSGVYAAMGALMGARGGVNIPEADRKGVYNHLARHYAEFGVTPPEFKSMDEVIDGYVTNPPLDQAVNHLKNIVNEFVESQREITEANKSLAESNTKNFVESLSKRFSAIELNIEGLQEGIKPGDEGLEKRLIALEQTILNLAKAMRETLVTPDEGRNLETSKRKTDEALRHVSKAQHILAEAMSKAIENKLGK